MKIGLMWYDKDGSTLERCNRAIEWFIRKYNSRPTAIMVHPDCAIVEIEGIKFIKCRSILPNNFWVGIEG